MLPGALIELLILKVLGQCIEKTDALILPGDPVRKIHTIFHNFNTVKSLFLYLDVGHCIVSY